MIILRFRRPKPAEPQIQPPATNPLESLFDLLNRDQRTTLTINRKNRRERGAVCGTEAEVRLLSSEISNSSPVGFSNKVKSRSRRTRRGLAYLAGLMSRLGEVFIVGVCLLTIVRVPAAMSAPSTRHARTTEQIHSHKPTEDTMSYLHPCGKIREEDMNKTSNKTAPGETDPLILRHIIIRTKTALAYAESFRERYVETTFHVCFERHHDQWANHRYDWLPDEKNMIPKRLGMNVNPLHLESKTFDEFLIAIYEYLQKYAVALEQVVVDQKRLQGEFRKNFGMMEVHLRNVLCEIHEAMMERNIAPRKQVSRSIMEEAIRHMEPASYRNVRDWFIFRDLMNCLEYVIQVFTFIEENLPQESSPAVESS